MKKYISFFLVVSLLVCFCVPTNAVGGGGVLPPGVPIETPNGLNADVLPQTRENSIPTQYIVLPYTMEASIGSSVYSNYYFKSTTGELYTVFNGDIDFLGQPSSINADVTISLYRTSDNKLVQSHVYANNTQWSNRVLKWNGIDRYDNHYIKVSKNTIIGRLNFTLEISQYP